MLAINEKWNLLNFFLFKEKNHSTSMRATARYTRKFFKIWVWKIIYMLMRVRSTYSRTPYVHIEGTEIENIRHKNHIFSCVLAMSQHSQKPSKSAIFSKIVFFAKKFKKFPFECCVQIALTPHGYFSRNLKRFAKFWKVMSWG